MILAVCPLAAPICLALFIILVATTRYVSLGSIVVVVAYLIQAVIFGQMGYLSIEAAYLPEFYIVSAASGEYQTSFDRNGKQVWC